MTRPIILDMDVVVVPEEIVYSMISAYCKKQDEHGISYYVSPRIMYPAMLSASPYPTAWDDVRKYVEGLEHELKDRDGTIKEYQENVVPYWKERTKAAEARIAELEEYLGKCVSNECFLAQDARRISEIEKAEAKISELEKRLVDAERVNDVARDIIARAQQNTPDHFSNWHEAARAYMEGK